MSDVDLLFLSKVINKKRENDKKKKQTKTRQDKNHVQSLKFPKQEIGSHCIASYYFAQIH